jgi:predicted RNase H-like HicB family nuclease
VTTVHFVAIVERADRGYSAFFPDLPGCVSAGETLQELALDAAEALALHLAGMAEDGEQVPAPTPVDRIPHDPGIHEEARFLVPAELPGRKVRVNVMLDEGLLAAIDAVASNRSGFLDAAARAALRERKQAA